MRRLFAMIRNEFLREFAYPLSLIFFILLPVLFTAAVGTGLSGMMNPDESEPEEFRTRLYVLQADSDPLVDAFLETLETVNLVTEVVETLPEDTFGLEIPTDFSERLLAGSAVTVTLHTLPNSTASQAVEQYVRAAQGRVGGAALIAKLGVEQARATGAVNTEAEEADFFNHVLEKTLEDARNPAAVAEVRWPEGVDAPQVERDMATSNEQASAGQLVTWVQITLLGAAEVLVNEKQGGTLKRMLVCPTARGAILTGKLLARLALGLFQMALLLAGGALIFGVQWGKDPVAVAVISLAFALATVGLGMFIATIVRTPGQANSVVVGLSMGMAALGGAWYPLEITPAFYQQVVKILPSSWAMRAYTDLLARGATLVDVLPHAGILLGFAVLFTTLGILRFRSYGR